MKKTHGQTHTPLYNVWYGIKQRCYYKKNISYKNYGARGIKICQEWLDDFMDFYNWAMDNGYQEGLTIDRIDVNGNYEPSNCKWSTKEQQANNKRNNVNFTYDDKTMSLKAWCRYLGISYKTCMTRKHRGHSIEECLNLVPLNDKRRKTAHNANLYSYNNRIYSIKQLADRLGIPKHKLYYSIKHGKLPEGVIKHESR